VDNLDETDLELQIQPGLNVYQIFTQVWMRTDDFLRPMPTEIQAKLNRYLLPTKFFGEDHGYMEDIAQFDSMHRRFKFGTNSSFVDILVEMRRYVYSYVFAVTKHFQV
jgi:hypothetical protein